jgi:hypothetical protein
VSLSKRYEDVALGDVARIGGAALVFTLLAGVCLVASGPVTAVVEPLPISRHGHDYIVVLGVLATMAVICWVISLGIFLTSPRQHDSYERWMKRRNRSTTEAVGKPRIRPDPASAHYEIPIWRYWRLRGR